MCVIVNLPAGSMLPKMALYNAVYNNPHSFGILIKDGNNKIMEIKKGLSDDYKEVDPVEVEKILEDNKDCQRILHLRWATRGDKSVKNAQPFQILESKGKQAWFFHNGTLALKFGDSGDKGISDTRDFAEKVLIPGLQGWHGKKGLGDYGFRKTKDDSDLNFFNLIIEPQWQTGSKGLLVSTYQDDFMFGPEYNGWTKFKVDGKEVSPAIWCSNDDYFGNVTRGPEKERRDQAIKDAKAKESAAGPSPNFRYSATNSSGKSTLDIVEYTLDAIGTNDAVMGALVASFNAHNLSDPDSLGEMVNVTREEFQKFCADENAEQVAELLVILTSALYESREEIKRQDINIHRKHNKIMELMGMEIKGEDTSTEEIPPPANTNDVTLDAPEADDDEDELFKVVDQSYHMYRDGMI